MPWFRIDDSFYDHPKVLDLSNAAVGLWTRAGTWCARHSTDGVIPATQVKAFRGTAKQINELISTSLWERFQLESGAKAYRFHDWNDLQPSRKEIESKRKAWRLRKQKARNNYLGNEDNQQLLENVPGGVTPMSHGVTSAGHRGESRPLSSRARTRSPSRPVPYQEEEGEDLTVVAGAGTDSPNPPIDNNSAIGSLDELAQSWRAAQATPERWSTPDDPRCKAHQGLPRAEVPPCGACADARKWFENKPDLQKQARRQAIDACDLCDENGMRFDKAENVARRCDHSAPKSRPRKPAPPF